MNITDAFNKTPASHLSDPFKKDCIQAIHIHVNKGRITNKTFCSATVEFENANTKGTHRIEADDFQGLVNKVHSFIDTL